jgi:hypothetical protein
MSQQRSKKKEIIRAVDQIQRALGDEQEEPASSPSPPKKPIIDESKIIRRPGNEISVSSVTRVISAPEKKKKKTTTPPGMMRVIKGATFTGLDFGSGGPSVEQQITEQLKMPHNQQVQVTHTPVNDGGGDSLDATIAQLNELVDGEIDIPPAPAKKAEPPNTLDQWDKIANRLCP